MVVAVERGHKNIAEFLREAGMSDVSLRLLLTLD